MAQVSGITIVAALDLSKNPNFGEKLGGTLILRAHEAYESAPWSWNRATDRRPRMIVRCSARSDILHAANFARNNSLLGCPQRRPQLCGAILPATAARSSIYLSLIRAPYDIAFLVERCNWR
jgi:hypothetical protein